MTKTKHKSPATEQLDELRQRVTELESANRSLREEIAAAKQITEKTAIFRRFAETSRQGFGMGTLDGAITWSNAALARILGFEKPEDVVGTLIPSYYLDEDRENLQNEILPAVVETGMATVEMPLVSIQGRVTPCSQAIFVIRDKDDNPLYLANVLTDISERVLAEEELKRVHSELERRVEERTAELRQEISERKRTEIALRESEENLSITLNSIGDAVIATDADGKITRMNPVAEILTGWSAAEAVSHDLNDVFRIIDAETRESIESPIDNVLRESVPADPSGNTILLARDGTERTISNSGAPIMDKNKSVFGLVFVFRDITEELALSEQLLQAQKMEAVGQLAGGVAHDFNNLLTAIMGNAQLLETRFEPDSEQAEFTQDIVLASTRAADLTEQLLAFSRKGQLQTADVDLHKIIEEVVELLSRSIDKRIDLTKDFMAEPAVVHGDATRLQNALLNLGVNARDAMRDGGEITFSTQNVIIDEGYDHLYADDIQAGTYVELNVTDTGSGIDQDLQQRIFEPFFTTKKIGRGTGLGLASVYGCIKSHKGVIKVYSEPGEGTTFRVLLPMVDNVSSSAVGSTRRELIRGEGNVLVVDDEEVIRNFAFKVLRGLGYKVDLCVDGAEALVFFRNHHTKIDLVLLDLVMPKIGGEKTFEQMQLIDPTVPVLITSGFSRSRTIEKLLDRGAVGFLKKPFCMEDISQEIANNIKIKPS